MELTSSSLTASHQEISQKKTETAPPTPTTLFSRLTDLISGLFPASLKQVEQRSIEIDWQLVTTGKTMDGKDVTIFETIALCDETTVDRAEQVEKKIHFPKEENLAKDLDLEAEREKAELAKEEAIRKLVDAIKNISKEEMTALQEQISLDQSIELPIRSDKEQEQESATLRLKIYRKKTVQPPPPPLSTSLLPKEGRLSSKMKKKEPTLVENESEMTERQKFCLLITRTVLRPTDLEKPHPSQKIGNGLNNQELMCEMVYKKILKRREGIVDDPEERDDAPFED